MALRVTSKGGRRHVRQSDDSVVVGMNATCRDEEVGTNSSGPTFDQEELQFVRAESRVVDGTFVGINYVVKLPSVVLEADRNESHYRMNQAGAPTVSWDMRSYSKYMLGVQYPGGSLTD